MRFVVTGAAGFVGRSLVRRLRAGGAEVVALARRESAGVTTLDDYADSPEGDVLVHLAQHSDRAVVDAQGAAAETEALSTLEALLAKRFGRVVYASSAAVYGDAHTQPRRVGDPTAGSSTYVRIKLSSEAAVLARGGVALRLANIYGPGMSAANVLSAVLRQLGGVGPLLVRDIAPVRDYLWHDDLAEALEIIARGGQRGILNLGSGVGTSVGELARVALGLAGQPGREVRATAEGRESCLVLDISDTLQQSSWRPRTTLREGLSALIVTPTPIA